MKQYLDYSDSRLRNGCILCYRQPDSRDHIPARTFLEKPYPSNLHVLPVCTSCNNGLSQDEEYVSFLLKLIKHLETGDINEYLKMERFTHADVLEKRILNGLSLSGDRPQSIPFLNIETNRIKNILHKYAFAHFCYERGEHPNGGATQIRFAFANQLTDYQIRLFNEIMYSEIWPEVGSRLFQRIAENGDSWMIIQEGNHRYYVSQDQPYVKIVIFELLFAEIIFDENK